MTTVSAMPTWEGFVLPILQVLADGAARRRRELHDMAADQLGLTPDQRAETLSSG